MAGPLGPCGVLHPRMHPGAGSKARATCMLHALLLALAASLSAAKSCPLKLPKGPATTFLLVADPGTFSSSPEAAVYLNNLRNTVKVPAAATACPQGSTGTIMGQSVAVFMTGIGSNAAALCVFDVVSQCGPYIKELIFSGTSGYSVQLGGLINNGTCETGVANTNGRITRTGDVCVSPFAVNWECRMASFQQTCQSSPNQCSFPGQDSGPFDDAVFGQCAFTNATAEQIKLTEELVAAAKRAASAFPRRAEEIQAAELQFWAQNKLANGQSPQVQLDRNAAPTIWSYRECMEVDAAYFWSGAPWDMVARKYVADTLNAALSTDEFKQDAVIAASAMEGVGVSLAMARHHSRSKRQIPFTYVRANSDRAQQPIFFQGGDTWLEVPGVPPQDFPTSYKYAVATASTAVLSLLQARCEVRARAAAAGTGLERANGSRAVPEGKRRPTACEFYVPYP